MKIGPRIRERREVLGLTQQELADHLGVTHQHVSRIEGEQALPSLDLVVRLAQFFGWSTDQLLTGRPGAVPDILGAIRADDRLPATIKRHLVALVEALRR
jgi:transcriptional regulator with XRE-family HTH domain